MQKISASDIKTAFMPKIVLSEAVLNDFAVTLCERLDELVLCPDTFVPTVKEVLALEKSMKAIGKGLKTLKSLEQQKGFSWRLLNISGRYIGERGYNFLDVNDVEAFIFLAQDMLKQGQFKNLKKGPDLRLRRKVAWVVIDLYTRTTKRAPTIGGQEKYAKKDGTMMVSATPFQRLCDVVSEKYNIELGRALLKIVIENGNSMFVPNTNKLPLKIRPIY